MISLEAADQAVKAAMPAYRAQLYATFNNPMFTHTEGILTDMPTTKPVDLKPYTIHLSAEDEAAVRNNTADPTTLRNLILDALPVPLFLYRGDVIEYTTGHKYEIARIHGDSIVLRRLSASSAGEIGTTLVELLDKTESDVRSGKAVIL